MSSFSLSSIAYNYYYFFSGDYFLPLLYDVLPTDFFSFWGEGDLFFASFFVDCFLAVEGLSYLLTDCFFELYFFWG